MIPDIRQYSFYQNKNVFCGSYHGLNFQILPKEELVVELWEELVSSGLAKDKREKSFPFTEDGFHQLSLWLGEQFDQRDA